MWKKMLLALVLVVLTACSSQGAADDTNKEKDAGQSTEGTLTEITFDDFFTQSDTGDGRITDKMLELEGKKVGIKGYMTEITPLEYGFVYLVPTAGAACPFCSSDNPEYIEAIAVFPPDGKQLEFTEEGLWAYGTLEVGEEVDPITGLISMFRLKADSIEPYQTR
ncbi:hypothetical protein ABN702_00885 [Bacillus haimaensis]|uniref:hypothetical protein n=1 Tax=Bacillus haimaensis TaxID=3160967 RepID=UPI003AA941AB